MASQDTKAKSDEVIELAADEPKSQPEQENGRQESETPDSGKAGDASEGSQQRTVSDREAQSRIGGAEQSQAERNGQSQAGRTNRPQNRTRQVPNRTSYSQTAQAQARRTGQPQNRMPGNAGQGRPAVRQNGQMQGRPPVRQAGQAQNPQNRPPYRQGSRPANGPQGQYVQGAMVQRRSGRPPQGAIPVRQGLFGRRMMEESRKMFRSPVFIIMALLNTVFMVTTLASVFLEDVSFSQVIHILANFDAPSELMGYANRIISLLSNLSSGMMVISLISHLPEILLCIGLWALIITAGEKEEEMSGIGFLCTKIYTIIKMVMTCIVLLICLILAVVFVVSAWVSGSQGPQIVSSIFIAVMIVITMVCVMYFFCVLHTIRVCRLNAIEGDDFGSASMFAAVLTIVIALFSVIGLLSAIVNAETVGIVSFACKIGWMLLAALWIIVYKNRINGEDEED